MRKTPPVVMRHDRHRGGSRHIEAWIHRALDVVGSALLLLLLSPLITMTAAAILARMGSPVLFRHERAGREGRPFVLLKFRTMRPPGSADTGPDRDHKRITRMGRLLRATSIDELPSLVNVLRGEMSLVGPRPLPVRYLQRYTAWEARRHEVRPGLTGWAQVNGRNALGWDDRLDLDVWYVEHRSIGLDLRILARTVGTVLRHDGVNHANHATMPEFERIDGQ